MIGQTCLAVYLKRVKAAYTPRQISTAQVEFVWESQTPWDACWAQRASAAESCIHWKPLSGMCQQDASITRYRSCPVPSSPCWKGASVKSMGGQLYVKNTSARQVQDSGDSEGSSDTLSSHATAAAAVLWLVERTLCPPVNSAQLSPDAAKRSEGQKASPQGARAPPAAAGRLPGQLPVRRHTPQRGAP